MAERAQILPGTLDLLILKAVSLGPLYGYGILLRIEQISHGALLIEQGALYPALFRLVRFPLIETDMRSYRIRLSEKTHDVARGRLPVRLGKQTNPNTSYRDSAGNLFAPGHGTLCFVHSHWRSLFLACRSTAS